MRSATRPAVGLALATLLAVSAHLAAQTGVHPLSGRRCRALSRVGLIRCASCCTLALELLKQLLLALLKKRLFAAKVK